MHTSYYAVCTTEKTKLNVNKLKSPCSCFEMELTHKGPLAGPPRISYAGVPSIRHGIIATISLLQVLCTSWNYRVD